MKTSKANAIAVVEDKEVKVIEKEIAPLVAKAVLMKIENDAQLVQSGEVLSRLNLYADNVKEKKDTVKKPLDLALKNLKGLFKPLEDKLEQGIEAIRGAQSAYQTEKVRLTREAEAKIASRIGEGKGKLKLETATEKMGEIEQPLMKSVTASGSLQFRKDKKLKITSGYKLIKDIMENHATNFETYVSFNETAILNALKAGVVIKGAEIELVQTPINRR